jgi:uncharacterized membrane protein YedE/YeeE
MLFSETPQFESMDAIPVLRLVAAGLFVGSGAQLGDGCTSGNGIQGLALFSPASLAFVVLFMAAGVRQNYRPRIPIVVADCQNFPQPS